MEDKLHERRALDAFALDVINAGDVQEVIFEVVGEVAFDLRRIHAAVGLRNINGRIANLRKNIDRHAPDGERSTKCDGNQGDYNGDRSAEGG